MKMLMITAYEGITGDVLDMLAARGHRSYTRIGGVTGSGTSSKPHLGTQVWPKLNTLIYVAMEDEQLSALADDLLKFREKHRSEGFKYFCWNLHEPQADMVSQY